MSGDDCDKEKIHITVCQYQKRYLEEQGYNASAVIRQALDDRMIEDGADPDDWKAVHGDGDQSDA